MTENAQTPTIENLNAISEVLRALQDVSREMALGTAYELITEFFHTIHNSMEGDHPKAGEVQAWLEAYDRVFLQGNAGLAMIKAEVEEARAEIEEANG